MTIQSLLKPSRIAVSAAAFCIAATSLPAQDQPPATTGQDSTQTEGRQRGRRQGGQNFNPEEMRTQMMTRLRETLEVTDDSEWSIIQDRLNAVMEIQRSSMASRMGGMMNMRVVRAQGAQDGKQNGGQRGFMGGQASPEAQALQTALQNKATEAELKERLARLRQSRKESEERLSKAQEELRAVLSLRQEATLVSMGMLN